jgi:hypothetical protein
MDSLLHSDESTSSQFTQQAISFSLHIVLALGTWFALLILLLSFLVPLGVGNLIIRFKQDEMAPLVWLIGLIWLLIISLWILDMPTGPNECFQCDATEKLTRTFFSLPKPSGLIDNDGPFICTWPAAALIGYAIGARLGLKKRPEPSDD